MHAVNGVGDWLSIHRINRFTYAGFAGAIKTTDSSLNIEARAQEARLSRTSNLAPGKTTRRRNWSIGGIFTVFLQIMGNGQLHRDPNRKYEWGGIRIYAGFICCSFECLLQLVAADVCVKLACLVGDAV